MSNNIQIIEIIDGKTKSEICDTVLRSLPNWFGIESAIVDYVRDVQKMETWAAQIDNVVVGFVSLNKHNENSAEVHVMGVLEKYHRNKIGQLLIEKSEKSLTQQGYKFIHVKTLSPSRPDVNYDKTRQFYLKMGFTPLEEFKTLWGEHNPCLLMVKELKAEPPPKNNYAVIFSSERNSNDKAGYDKTANRMVELAQSQKGFLGIESSRDSNGFGITISYWESLDDIKRWKTNSEHLIAQQLGKSEWYKSFKTKICKIERAYEYGKN